MGKASDLFRKDRYRSAARLQAGRPYSPHEGDASSKGGPTPPAPLRRSKTESAGLPARETGEVDEKDAGRGGSLPAARDGRQEGNDGAGGGAGVRGGGAETSFRGNEAEDTITAVAPPAAPSPFKSEAAGAGDSAVKSTDAGTTTTTTAEKPKLTSRMLAGSKRFGVHTKNALFHSWVNVLLIFVPIGIAVEAVGLNPSIVFAMNAVAIIPLAGLLSFATESVARRLGDTLGALLNVSFGNAVELIIFIIALVKNEIRIVQASLLGSILANLLLILGMAFLFGGLRFREQVYNSTVTQMSACLLSLSVMSLLLPTAFHASFNDASTDAANVAVLRVSRGTSVILLIVYILYLLFQLKSHAYMYESTPQHIIDEESHPGLLHDIMDSSSSSSDTDDSTDGSHSSDTSGSIMTTGKRIRKLVRRRRKSSASVSSTAGSSVVQSVISSPSTERQSSYWEQHQQQQANNHPAYQEPTLGMIASGDEGDVENEKRSNNMPRIRDFVDNAEQSDMPRPYHKKSKKKHHKKHHKKHRVRKEAPDLESNATADNEKVEQIDGAPKVGFADDVQIVPDQGQPTAMGTPGKTAFNMRQLSSKVAYRPALPKVLSQNVFVTPAPQPERAAGAGRPPPPIRARTTHSGLRRTSSLPDRLNRQPSAPASGGPSTSRTDPLPPYQHQRLPLHRPKSEDAAAADDSDEDDDKGIDMSRTAAIVLLLVSTALVAVCAEFMVDAIPDMIAESPISQAFIGLIILPIVGNAAEHVTAVTVATKNKMDLAIGVAVGSSIQIALFVTPIVVLLGWILKTNMSLYFNLFETVSLFVTAFVVNFLVLDGRSNYLEGSLLIAAYVIIAVGAFYYPPEGNLSGLGGASTP